MSDIRKSLESLADSIESLEKQPSPKTVIKDRELSGNKIHGGMITNFSSVGIKDEAKQSIVAIKDEGLYVDEIYVKKVANPLTVEGKLDVNGNLNVDEIFAKKIHVNEVSADVRNERTSPLEFKGESKPAFGKGILWTGGKHTKQFILKPNPDRLWSSEDIDVNKEKSFMIGGQPVLTETSLGDSVTSSKLKRVGTLQNLEIAGSLNVDHFVKYNGNTEQFSIGSEDPSGMFTIESFDHQFVIDPTEEKNFKIGTWTTSGIDVVTDDTTRIRIENSGKINIISQTSFAESVGIGVKNFENDVNLTVSGGMRLDNRKHEVGSSAPALGTYIKGDTVWNSDPKPTGYIGWVCVKSGTPGNWKPFGQIAS